MNLDDQIDLKEFLSKIIKDFTEIVKGREPESHLIVVRGQFTPDGNDMDLENFFSGDDEFIHASIMQLIKLATQSKKSDKDFIKNLVTDILAHGKSIKRQVKDPSHQEQCEALDAETPIIDGYKLH